MATTTSRNPVQSPKDPNTDEDYGVNWADRLPSGVTVSSATVKTITPNGELTAGSPTVSSPTVTARFTGGTAGTDYAVTFRLTLSDAQTKEVTITIPVRER